MLNSRTIVFFACLLIAPFWGFCQPAAPATSAEKRTLFEIFNNEGETTLNITSNFDSIKANIRNKDYVQGTFEIAHSRKHSTVLKLKLRPRGKSRRMMCDFPPLKLKFDKESLLSNSLAPFNDYKLVTHCLDDQFGSDEILKKEFLVYKLFNQLTPYSFKAHLVNITYKNTGSSFKKITRLGIIIEDAESLASRNQCGVLANKIINIDSLHSSQEKIAAVFQYMIGNADWSFMMGRNIELIKMADNRIVPVPYDFDYAGLVKAPYARADRSIGQTTVLDRVYKGNPTSYEELQSIFSYFKSKKEDLIRTVDEFDSLSEPTREEMKIYLLGFFDIIESRVKVEQEMLALTKKE